MAWLVSRSLMILSCTVMLIFSLRFLIVMRGSSGAWHIAAETLRIIMLLILIYSLIVDDDLLMVAALVPGFFHLCLRYKALRGSK